MVHIPIVRRVILPAGPLRAPAGSEMLIVRLFVSQRLAGMIGAPVDLAIAHTSDMPWQSGLDVVGSMTREFRDNLGPADQVERLFATYHQKTLFHDPETTRRFDLVRLDGGYGDITCAYHDSVEECYVLDGEVHLEGEGSFDAGGYFWRPPGWVHAARTANGMTALLMLQGEDPDEGSFRTSRRIRLSSEAGSNPLRTAEDPLFVGPRGWVRTHDRHLPWLPGAVYARTQGTVEAWDLGRLDVRVLSANAFSGGQSIVLRLHAGYADAAASVGNARIDVFVLAGDLHLGDEALHTGSYARIPAGVPMPPVHSDGGATLFVKIDGWAARTAV
jgi:hypothetical protein